MKKTSPPNSKRPQGRPPRPMPEPIPDSPENIMRALLATPPKKREEWDFMQDVSESERKEIVE